MTKKCLNIVFNIYSIYLNVIRNIEISREFLELSLLNIMCSRLMLDASY